MSSIQNRLRRFISALVILGTVALCAPGNAQAMSFTLAGGGTYAMPTGTLAGTPTFGYGGGLMLEFALSPRVAFELDGLFLQRVNSSFTLNTVEAPLMFRFWLARFLSIGVGGYGAYVLGAPSDIRSLDYGAAASFMIKIAFGGRVGLILDARYLYGLANISVGGTSAYAGPEAFAGLRFMVGGKGK